MHPIITPDPLQGFLGSGPEFRERREHFVGCLVTQLHVGSGETESFGNAIHAQLAPLVLVAVQETCDESVRC